MKLYLIPDEIFSLPLSFVEGTAEEFDNHLKENGLYEKETTSEGRTVSDGKKSAMWIRNFRKLSVPGAMAVLAHEMVHHAFNANHFRSLNLGKENDEVFAYYIQMMTERLLNKLFIKVKKSKKK